MMQAVRQFNVGPDSVEFQPFVRLLQTGGQSLIELNIPAKQGLARERIIASFASESGGLAAHLVRIKTPVAFSRVRTVRLVN